MLINAVILILKLSFVISAQYAERRPTIRLEQGILTGFRITDARGEADVFLGIPYASPPIKNLRFAPPQKHTGWNGTLDAVNYAPPCPQIPILNNQSEDCLYLNVWAPEYWHRFAPKPVMIFFEGVDYSRSNKIRIPGQDLAMEDVIVVTISYRLNVFGFLCLGIPEARGNLGLLDQYVSILWVKQNIKHFGGNPEKITLFGYSSGAASVVLHLTSPRTAGLFQKIIISSGSPTSPWHMSKDPLAASRKFANVLRCSDNELGMILRCMRRKSVSEILETYQNYIEMGNVDLFLPVVDDFLPEGDRYLPKDPLRSIKEGAYVQVAILMGISNLVAYSQQKEWNDLSRQGPLHLQQYIEQVKIPEIIKRYDYGGGNKDIVMELLKWRYMTPSHSDGNPLLNQLVRLEFDSKIEAPHYSFLNHLEATYVEPIYAYHLEDDSTLQLNITDSTVTSDILLLFGPLLLNQIARRKFNSREEILSEKLKKSIKNFVVFGNPSPSKTDWPRYEPGDYYVEYFDNKAQSPDEILSRNQRILFWKELLPKVAHSKTVYPNTYSKELLTYERGSSFKHAMYTLVGLVVALLVLLAICIFLLKKSYKERERHLHMIY